MMQQSRAQQYDDEKRVLSDDIPRPVRRRLSSRRLVVAIALQVTALVLLLYKRFEWFNTIDLTRDTTLHDSNTWMLNKSNVTKVALEAHIMSKCPDARDCLQQLILPAMEQASEKVDFTLSYIGSLDPGTDEVHCMHGPSECLGNIIQLCAQSMYPDPKLYLGFANCMTSKYRDIPDRDLVEGCAMEHGLNFTKLNGCISEEGHGMDLLRKSIDRSRQNHVTKSCTVRLEGKVRCIRDGGKWYDCPGGSKVSDLTDDIDDLFNKHNPKRPS